MHRALAFALALACPVFTGCFQPGGAGNGETEAVSGDTPTTDASSGEAGGASCDAANEACVLAAPNGWAGPTFVYQTPTGQTPMCPSAAPDISADRSVGLSAEDAICGCECGAPLDSDCPSATLESHAPATCDTLISSDELVVGECLAVAGAQSFNIQAGLPATPLNGSCEATPSVDTPEPVWAEAVRACIGQPTPAEDCNRDEVCVAQPPLSPAFRLCVHRAGGQSCPLEGYTERFEAFAGVQDDRGCEECTCGEVVDGLCARTAVFYATADCTGTPLASGTMGAPLCVPAVGANSVSLEGEISGECPPSTPAAVGEAVPSGTETFCCLP